MNASQDVTSLRNVKPPLTQFTKIAYGMGQVSHGVKDFSFHYFVIFYFAQVRGMDPKLAGTAALIAIIWDALTDPLVGNISDNWRSKWGRRHPFIAFSAIPFGFFMCMLFNPPMSLSPSALFWWLLVSAIAVRTFLTFFFVPHMSLGAELSDDFRERTSIAGYRVFCGYLGGLGIAFVGQTYLFPETPGYANPMLNPEGFSNYGFLAGGLITFSILWTTIGTWKQIPYLPEATGAGSFRRDVVSSYSEMLKTLRLKSFRVLFISGLFIAVVWGVQFTLNLYSSNYLWGLNPVQIGILALAVGVGSVLSFIVTPLISGRLGKHKSAFLFASFAMLMAGLPVTLRLLGFFPGNESPALFGILFLFSGLSHASIMSFYIVGGSMVADVVDEYELETNKRQEGIFFAAQSFISKASFGIGSFVAGWLLSLIAFPTQVAADAVPADVIVKFSIVMGPCIAITGFLAALGYLLYGLDQDRHGQIRKQLEERRKAAGET